MKLRAVFILSVILLLQACNTNNTKEEGISSINQDDIKKQINVQNFLNTIPSYTEVFQVIQASHIYYNPDLLNDPAQHKNYSLEKSRAFNLGVYGADLAISGAFNQAQESMLFLKCANYLAKELGISDAFNENIMDRLEANKENRDSVLEIVSHVFKDADKLFENNKRGELSVFMITGAFLESMCVAGEYAMNKSEDSLSFNKIISLYGKQQEPLSYLINLLNNVPEKDAQLINTLTEVNNHLKNKPANKEGFNQMHQLITSLRKQIISVY